MKLHRQKLPYKLLERIASATNPFTVVNDNTYTPVEGAPIIFAVNHSNMQDFPSSFHAIGRHAYPLMGEQPLDAVATVFFYMTGKVMADRMDRKDTAQAKDAMIKLLKKRKTILYFPEGTWNMTDNLLMLPMKWGIIDVAQFAGAQIIPVAMEYDRADMVCTVRFGQPMYGAILEDKAEAIRDLRDAMASLRWELISRAPALKKDEIDRAKLKADVLQAIEEYEVLTPEMWASEQKLIFRPYEETDVLPPGLIPHRENAFLFSKKWSG